MIYWHGRIPLVDGENVTYLDGYHCNSTEPLALPDSYRKTPDTPYMALYGGNSYFYSFASEAEFLELTGFEVKE